MRKLFSSRLLPVIVILVVGVMVVGLSMGVAAPQASADASDLAAPASTGPQLDWALAGLLMGGALITLLRPRKRKIVKVTNV